MLCIHRWSPHRCETIIIYGVTNVTDDVTWHATCNATQACWMGKLMDFYIVLTFTLISIFKYITLIACFNWKLCELKRFDLIFNLTLSARRLTFGRCFLDLPSVSIKSASEGGMMMMMIITIFSKKSQIWFSLRYS